MAQSQRRSGAMIADYCRRHHIDPDDISSVLGIDEKEEDLSDKQPKVKRITRHHWILRRAKQEYLDRYYHLQRAQRNEAIAKEDKERPKRLMIGGMAMLPFLCDEMANCGR